MYDNYNYPAGADTPDAPWNQSDPDFSDYDEDAEAELRWEAENLDGDFLDWLYDTQDVGKFAHDWANGDNDHVEWLLGHYEPIEQAYVDEHLAEKSEKLWQEAVDRETGLYEEAMEARYEAMREDNW